MFASKPEAYLKLLKVLKLLKLLKLLAIPTNIKRCWKDLLTTNTL
jgi:hypothetical protein